MTLEIGKNTKMCNRCKKLPEQCTCLSEFEERIAVDFDEKVKKEQFHHWLTEVVLNECWHELVIQPNAKHDPCSKCGRLFNQLVIPKEGNRTFTTWQDFGDVVTALIKQKEGWNSFMYQWWGDIKIGVFPTVLIDPNDFFLALYLWWEREIKK